MVCANIYTLNFYMSGDQVFTKEEIEVAYILLSLKHASQKEAKKRPARRRVPVRWIRRSARIRRQKRDAATKANL